MAPWVLVLRALACVLTGLRGVDVPLAATVRGFKEIVEGKHDDLVESDFYMVGAIEQAQEKARQRVEAAA